MQYTLRENPRSRRINITVRRDGSVWVTKPRRVAIREVERFIAQSAQWIERMRTRFAQMPKTSRIESSAKEYKKLKETARKEIVRHLRRLNSIYQFSYRKVFIRNQKTRWGSCSHAGNLSFNYRILFLPPHLADYIVVHELCHLREMNHSKRFWELVAQTIPDHRECRKELRKFERGLLIDS
jgi:predicted metal-dependent hydrolase